MAFVNDMNGIYQRDLSVRFVMIDNTNIIYPPGGPEPYTNGNEGVMLGQNQTNLDKVIGNANYAATPLTPIARRLITATVATI